MAPSPPPDLTPAEARSLLRGGDVVPSGQMCFGYVQANVLAVPRDWAYDVLLFAQRNPHVLPLLEVLDEGTSSRCAAHSDIRTDCAKYQVWCDGAVMVEPNDVLDHWREGLVTFLFGSSVTFEHTLARAGVALAHYDNGPTVPLYVTDRVCEPGGRFTAPVVASMRYVPSEQIALARWCSSRFPAASGLPLHIGEPMEIGIEDIAAPLFGTAGERRPGQVPMFWPSALSISGALRAAEVPFAITHAPGHLFITDLPDVSMQVDASTVVPA